MPCVSSFQRVVSRPPRWSGRWWKRRIFGSVFKLFFSSPCFFSFAVLLDDSEIYVCQRFAKLISFRWNQYSLISRMFEKEHFVPRFNNEVNWIWWGNIKWEKRGYWRWDRERKGGHWLGKRSLIGQCLNRIYLLNLIIKQSLDSFSLSMPSSSSSSLSILSSSRSYKIFVDLICSAVIQTEII